ncbi:type II toxin-antitoxin system HicB family antitoxin [Pseudacidovorax intermedius]|uniref:type II toxin-antitoxin system HicB family antitoxin n=1 Tax=Pseudacidovorax intermedius TaxID=433924 RepID=UPI00034B9357|nr:type II toxin-antitoxin system HicB family antitoxin [Pseudacidovorax intermedius]
MLYPVYVHKDKDSAFGLTVPDLPGCFAAADEPAGIPSAAQEAVEVHYGNDAEPITAPTGADQWAGSKDFKGGSWMLVDIDLAKVRDKGVPVNVSMY